MLQYCARAVANQKAKGTINLFKLMLAGNGASD
jgi:hypothetical protein